MANYLRFTPWVLICALYLFLQGFLLGIGSNISCALDGVNMSYIMPALTVMWIGGATSTLLISSALLYFYKCHPEWQYCLWSILPIPLAFLILVFTRTLFCFGLTKTIDEVTLLLTGGAALFFYSSLLAMIVSIFGLGWSKRRSEKGE